MKYGQPCDHCGGEIHSGKLYLFLGAHLVPPPAGRGLVSGTPYWLCYGCGCVWTLDFVLKEKGSKCPVHGEHGNERR